MFTMMNNARLAVGLQGVAIAERAYQQALAYARERKQGRAPVHGGDGHRARSSSIPTSSAC
jgi:acyl-CoA dehydrogenase